MDGKRPSKTSDRPHSISWQAVTGYDYYTEVSFQQADPNYGRIVGYQTPRTARFGVRFEF